MDIGYILVGAVLLLGGIIATVGDRLGMKIGRARLTLFNLRPRQTATVISILTGGVISATTLGLLFGVSEELRDGLFRLGEIRRDLREAIQERETVQQEKQAIEDELATSKSEARKEQAAAQRKLRQINRSLQDAIDRQAVIEQRSKEELEKIEQQAQAQIARVSQQANQLRAEIAQLETDRGILLAQKEREISNRQAQLQTLEGQLQDLERQQLFLARAVTALEQESRRLRQGSVAIVRNQVLASGVVRVLETGAASQAVNQLLSEANRTAFENILPGANSQDRYQVIRITNRAVEQLARQINDGGDYVIRILSAANYVVGEACVTSRQEPCIQVFPNAVPNRIIFQTNDVIATTPLDRDALNDQTLVERFNLLVTNSRFRVQQAGVVSDELRVGDGRSETVLAFFEQVKAHNQPLDLQAIAASDIYTAGPVRLELIAVQNGQILFRTG